MGLRYYASLLHVRFLTLAAIAATISATFGCQYEAPPLQGPVSAGVWKEVARFSGRGNAQLDTFPIERFTWRVRWEASNEQPPGAGTLQVTAHSGDSGRLLAEVVDATGVGSDVAYVTELPHRYYLVVKSSGVDWTLIAEEPVLQ